MYRDVSYFSEYFLQKKQGSSISLCDVTDVSIFCFLAYVFFVVKGMNPSQRRDWISIIGNTALC